MYLRFKSCLGSGCWVHHVTPTEPLLQKMTHRIYAASTIPTFVSSILLYGEALQVSHEKRTYGTNCVEYFKNIVD